MIVDTTSAKQFNRGFQVKKNGHHSYDGVWYSQHGNAQFQTLYICCRRSKQMFAVTFLTQCFFRVDGNEPFAVFRDPLAFFASASFFLMVKQLISRKAQILLIVNKAHRVYATKAKTKYPRRYQVSTAGSTAGNPSQGRFPNMAPPIKGASIAVQYGNGCLVR